MWTCPYCGGRTEPISISELNNRVKKRIIREFKTKENPVIVKCGKVRVDGL